MYDVKKVKLFSIFFVLFITKAKLSSDGYHI